MDEKMALKSLTLWCRGGSLKLWIRKSLVQTLAMALGLWARSLTGWINIHLSHWQPIFHKNTDTSKNKLLLFSAPCTALHYQVSLNRLYYIKLYSESTLFEKIESFLHTNEPKWMKPRNRIYSSALFSAPPLKVHGKQKLNCYLVLKCVLGDRVTSHSKRHTSVYTLHVHVAERVPDHLSKGFE